MNAKMFHAGAAAALLWAGAARAGDAQQTPTPAQQRDAVHAAVHDAMQAQMAAPPATAQMPGMTDRTAGDATRAREHEAQMQQVRQAARQRAMKHGAQDAAMARGGDAMRGGMQSGTRQGGMMGDSSTTQQGAGMMRTGDMHGGSGGMMPGSGGGGMMGGSGMGTGTAGSGTGTGGGMMSPGTGTTTGTTGTTTTVMPGTGTTTGTTGTTTTGMPSGGSMMGK